MAFFMLSGGCLCAIVFLYRALDPAYLDAGLHHQVAVAWVSLQPTNRSLMAAARIDASPTSIRAAAVRS